eukprot:TRINITY_DN8647_c0_g1_i1.p1 TRINITY_DN8647_c0_g1~~TRINITY_DN8647_c0_g1_i1.p1  ORF type:complete len:267 (+),score=57.42 TRINITY_DN8647_c0_g1_i1:410-1210(+)
MGKLIDGEMFDQSPSPSPSPSPLISLSSPSLGTAISSLNISSDVGMTSSSPSTPHQKPYSFSSNTPTSSTSQPSTPSTQFTIPISPRSSGYNTSTTSYSNPQQRSSYNTSSTTTSSGFKFTPPVNFQYFNSSPQQSYTFPNIPLQSNTVSINPASQQIYPQRIPLNNLQSITPPSLSPRPSLTTGSANSPRGNSPDQSPREKEATQTTPRKKEASVKPVPALNWGGSQTIPASSQSEHAPLSNEEGIGAENEDNAPKRMDINHMLN